jgi:tight adherence protein B
VGKTQAGNSSLFKSLDAIAREVGDVKGVKPGLRQRLDRILLQAGVSFSLPDLFQYSVLLAMVFGVAVGVWRHNLWLALAAAPAGACIPIAYVWMKWGARLEALRHQLPDAFDAMARSLRAGQTLEQALQSIAQEFGAPLGPEFSYCFEQQNLGLPRESAYRELAQRSGLMELQIMVVAILVQQQSGGNLAELLDKLAVVVRERFRMRDKIRTLTAESKFQAMVLMVMPPLMFLVLLVVKKSYIVVLFSHPWLLAGVIAMQVVAAFWIHRISNFRY